MKETIKTGDKMFVRSNSFLSKGIRFFMKLYAKKFKIDYKGKLYSHVGIFLWINKKLYIAEAVENGFRIREFEKHYSFDDPNISIIKRNVYLSEEKMVGWLIGLQEKNVCYQFTNFIQWPLYIIFGIDTFKSNDKYSYCYEACKRFDEFVEPGSTSGRLEVASFYDIYHA